MAIRDWDLKKEILRVAFRCPRTMDVIDKIIDSESVDEKYYANLLDHYAYRWSKEKFSVGENSKYRSFFVDLSAAAELNEPVPGVVIIDGSAEDLVKAMNDKSLALLTEALKDSMTIKRELRETLVGIIRNLERWKGGPSVLEPFSQDAMNRDDHSYSPIWTAASADTLRLIQHGLETGDIDQSLCYLSSDSAYLWFALTNNDFYSGFDQCKTGLIKLVRSPVWQEFIRSPSFGGVFMLGGGGSTSKDGIIINSLHGSIQEVAPDKRSLTYVLLDTSQYMLTASKAVLERGLKKLKSADSISLLAIEGDMMDMGGAVSFIGKGDRAHAWFLTGGTLGNLPERRFFQSIARHACRGDLLIVGVGCYDDEPEEEFVRDLISEYELAEVRELLKGPVAAVWSELDLHGPLSEAAAQIEIRVKVGGNNDLSDVEDAVTVYGSLPVPGRDPLRLFKSSRYREPRLVDLAEQSNWEFVSSIDGLDNSFRQLIFRYSDH